MAWLIPTVITFCIWVEPTLQNGMVYVIVVSMCLWKVRVGVGWEERKRRKQSWRRKEWEWERKGESGVGTRNPTCPHLWKSWDVRNYDGGIDLRIVNMNSNTFAHLQFLANPPTLSYSSSSWLIFHIKSGDWTPLDDF